jgi:hypothetical protein
MYSKHNDHCSYHSQSSEKVERVNSILKLKLEKVTDLIELS